MNTFVSLSAVLLTVSFLYLQSVHSFGVGSTGTQMKTSSELVQNRMRRSPYAQPPLYPRRVYAAPRPFYPPRPAVVPYAPRPGVEAEVAIQEQGTKSESVKHKEMQEVVVESGVDNHSAAKAKILPVSVNVTADAGVKTVVDALNDLLRQGLLNEAPATPVPKPSSAEKIIVDVDVDVTGGQVTKKEHKIVSVPDSYTPLEELSPQQTKLLAIRIQEVMRKNPSLLDRLVNVPFDTAEGALSNVQTSLTG